MSPQDTFYWLKPHNSVTFENGHPVGWPFVSVYSYSAMRNRSTTVFCAILL